MATTATRRNLEISQELDADLREFLKNHQGGASDADVAAFVEDAVRDRMFDLTCEAAQRQNAHLDAAEIEQAVDEALKWARQQQ